LWSVMSRRLEKQEKPTPLSGVRDVVATRGAENATWMSEV
jgi:hypothetical protein